MKKFLKPLIILFSIVVLDGCSSNGDEDKNVPVGEKSTATISATKSAASEPATNGEFTIKLSKSVTVPVTLSLKFGGTAKNGEDYKTIANSVTVSAKSNSVVIPVEILSDKIAEGEETVEITLTASSNADVVIGNPEKASLTITDEVVAIDLKPEQARNYMVNKNATDETVALFYNLKTLAKTSFMIGQHDALLSFYKNNTGDSDIKKTTGFDPGMSGGDFMFIADDENTGKDDNWWYAQEKLITGAAVKAYNKGMVNMFCWHLREPYEGKSFYTSEMTDIQKKNAFKSILPGGVNHEYYKKKLEKIAQVTKALKGTDGKLIPIIFRPFHEFDGDWFWWGKSFCTADEYIQNWRFTVEYLRDTLGVSNMLFAFSPDASFTSESDYLSRYPGDAYVDVLGFDDYGDFDNKGESGVNNANKKLQIISKLAKERVKIAGLTETGYFITPGKNNIISGLYSTNFYNAMTQNNVDLSFITFWGNGGDTYCTPPPAATDASDFIQFTRKDKAALLNKTPNMYKMP
ncbi:mannan endo-1,4-beta-mannosidase [Flavobacterium aquidurense]|jgi:mannan endo-1,4-beta-mannosidase|uniref:glycosyl hydrolase n=1 Tax=Flavobacterium TaxID=237 RepID=UPI00089420EC|nr:MULTISPECIES: glycosyl hydrolase [Flavobacterium]TDW46636.1 mannan endo-1,4-beta-mannosidase [Flavobacterium sp. 270]SDZ59011.1 mannan endo-1,4-beta-mannosidase [Flavobacterium aquidurense]